MRRVLSVCVLLLCALPLLATEGNPSREQRVLIEKLLRLMEVDDNVSKVTDAMFQQIEKQYMQEAEAEGNDEETLADAKELFAGFRAHASKIDFNGLLHEEYVRMYAKYFNEKELADLNTFYETPTGAKTIQVLAQLTNDAFQAGMQILGPKIDEAMQQAAADFEKKRPWRRTMSDIRTIAVSVEAYATDNDRYPTGDLDAVEKVVEPDYVRELPKKDMWGHDYAYVVSPDGMRYRVVSAGADGVFEWDSRRIAEVKEDEIVETRYRDRLEDDIIFADGEFVQAPMQTKPKD